MDTQMVLQVIVVDKFGVAVETDVGALTCVLPHVDFEFVLSGGKKKKFSLRLFGQKAYT